MSDLNKVLLIGRLGSKPELRKTQGDGCVAHLNVATSHESQKAEGQFERETEWHRVVVFGRLAEQCTTHLDKGRLVYVEGTLRTNMWKDSQNVEHTEREVRARHVSFLGSRPRQADAQAQDVNHAQAAAVLF